MIINDLQNSIKIKQRKRDKDNIVELKTINNNECLNSTIFITYKTIPTFNF